MIFNIFSLSSGLGAVIVLAVLYALFKNKSILFFLLFLLCLSLEYFTGIFLFILSMGKTQGISIFLLLLTKLICQAGIFISGIFTIFSFTGVRMRVFWKISVWILAAGAFLVTVAQIEDTPSGMTVAPLLFIVPAALSYSAYICAFIFLLTAGKRFPKSPGKTIRLTAVIGLGIIIPAMAAEDVYLFLSPSLLRVLVDPLAFLFLTGATLFLSVLYLARRSRGMITEQSIEDYCTQMGISRRETQILRLLLEGSTYKEIAEKLFISVDTVKTHITRLYRKCGATGRTDLKYKIRLFRSE